MTSMNGGQALVRQMRREGIEIVFGIPTAGQYEAVDALWETPEVRYISVRHEQAATYIADGYARAGGGFAGRGIAGTIVAPGPGLLNALSGMATASDACSPMLVVSGTWPDHLAPPDDESWRPMSKWTARLERPAEIPGIVREAAVRLQTGVPGPALLLLPRGTLAKVEEVELLDPQPFDPPAPDEDAIREAAQLLRDADTPAIWAGGGVHRANATEALVAVSEHLQAPVLSSPAGKGALSDRHPLSLGMGELRYAPLRQWLDGRDVILVVGSRSGLAPRPPGQRIVRVDADENRMAADESGDIGIAADARLTLNALREALVASPPREDSAIAAEVAALLKERFAPHNQLEPQCSLMRAVREAVPYDSVIVQGMNQMGYYSRNYLQIYDGGSYLTASHHGTLGHAFPVGLGAKLACPDRAVVVLEGDGGFLYNSQELATAVQYGINAVVIVFNDNAYGNPLRSQIEEYDGHVLGTQLHNPDFVALAGNYGARGRRADDADELKGVLAEALAAGEPTLIEVPVGGMDRVY